MSFCSILFDHVSCSIISVDPTFERHIFLHAMESIRIIIRKEIWRIRRGDQSTNIIFRGNRDGSWGQIWGISGFLMHEGGGISSMVMGGR